MSKSEVSDISERQLSSVLESHIRLCRRLNGIKVEDNIKDDRELGRRKAMLQRFTLWLEDLKRAVRAPKA